jgi:4-amino-4-deoxy-L-arabinose transferase-like glycosyltransferase
MLSRRRSYLAIVVLLLLVAAFFRLWHLTTIPPGLLREELVNAQLADSLRRGNVSVVYDEISPGREGLYITLLSALTALTGRGLMLWRVPSVYLSLLGLSVTASLMKRLIGPRAALLTVGLMAVAFWPVWMGRAALHVTMMPLMSALVAYILTRAFAAEDRLEGGLWFTIGGLVVGLALYAHVTAWVLLLIIGAFLIYLRLVNRNVLRLQWENIVYALVLALVVTLPLWIYLAQHPGIRALVPLREQADLLADLPRRVGVSLSGLALRGDMLPNHNVPGRPALDPVSAILFAIGLGIAVARWRQPGRMVLLLWLVFGLVPAALLPHVPDFEYMALVMPVAFVFPALALDALLTRLRLRAAICQVVMVALVLGNGVWSYRDIFVRWPRLGDMRLNYQADIGLLAHYLDTSRDPSPVVICVTPVDRSEDPFALPNDLLLTYFMHRTTLPIRYFDCTQSLVIAEGGASQRMIFPHGHYYDLPAPLLAWLQGSQDEPVPGIRPDIIRRVEVEGELADYVGAFMTTEVISWPPEAGGPEPMPLPARLSDSIAFLGDEVRDTSIRRGEWLEVVTYWRMDGLPPRELRLFAHLLSDPTVVVAQDDRLGVRMYTLRPRDVFLQYSMIQTRSGMTPDEYTLSVGLYVPATGRRLPIYDGEEMRANRIYLQPITIEP